MEFDQRVPELLNALKENDWLIITADHGNDPTFKGSDHTRECVPFMVTRSSLENGQHLGDFRGFHHCAKLILDLFELNESLDSLTELCPLIKDLP